MDDLNVQQQNQVKPPDRNDPKPRVEPRDQDKDKFERKVDKKRGKEDDEQAGESIASLTEDDDKEESIFSLANSSRKKKGSSQDDISKGQSRPDLGGISRNQEDLGDLDVDEDGEGKNKVSLDFGKDSRSDLFQLISTNTSNITAPSFDAGLKSNASSISRKEAFDIAQQMIEKITEIKTQGQTSTELTLKQPPLFEGSKITIKEFDSAKGQFNLSFENLSPHAKMMIDLESSKDMLKQTLQEKGYNVHIIIATVDIEKPEYKQDANAFHDDRQQRDQGQGQEQQKNKEQR